MDKTTELEKRIQALEKIIKDLEYSNTIPLNIDRAFQGRGFLKLPAPPPPGAPQVFTGTPSIGTYVKIPYSSGDDYYLPVYIFT